MIRSARFRLRRSSRGSASEKGGRHLAGNAVKLERRTYDWLAVRSLLVLQPARSFGDAGVDNHTIDDSVRIDGEAL